MELSDSRLVVEAMAGSDRAFDELVSRYCCQLPRLAVAVAVAHVIDGLTALALHPAQKLGDFLIENRLHPALDLTPDHRFQSLKT